MIDRTVTIAQAAQMLKNAHRLLLLTHSRPDGDTLGSAYGLAYALPGKEITIVNDDTPGERLDFLCEGTFPLTPFHKVQGEFDLIVAIDVADNKLLGDYVSRLPRVDLKIDHHAMGKDFAAKLLVDPTAAACGEIVYEIVCALGSMNAKTADCLYAAISSDTGSFRYQNTTPRTHEIAAALIRAGCRHSEIDHQLFESHTPAEIKAMRLVWEKVCFLRDGKIAMVTVTNEDKQNEGLSDPDTGIMNSMPREIMGVELGIVLKQSTKHPEEYKVSLRSCDCVNANEICALLGGGGHARAAGATVSAASAQQAQERVLWAVNEVWHD